MSWLLDTNACIRILNDGSSPVVTRLRRCEPRRVFLCSVVKAELAFGARRSTRVEANLRSLELFVAPFPSLPFDDGAAEHYGAIRAELEAVGKRIGAADLLIASIARSHDLTLVTNNTREFARVVGLRVEDWETPHAWLPAR